MAIASVAACMQLEAVTVVAVRWSSHHRNEGRLPLELAVLFAVGAAALLAVSPAAGTGCARQAGVHVATGAPALTWTMCRCWQECNVL